MKQPPVTTRLFADYLDCPTKCFLRAVGETPTDSDELREPSPSNRSEVLHKLFDENSIVLDRPVKAGYLEATVNTARSGREPG